MPTATYIGAGLDLRPIILFPLIDTFIYIDSMPISPYGTLSYDDEQFYNDSFCNNLIQLMFNYKFTIIKQSTNYIEFNNGKKILKYYLNTAFPQHLTDNIIADINKCDTLILCGFCPNKKIIELMPKLSCIIGSHTCYSSLDIYEDEQQLNDSSFQYIINNPDICKTYLFMNEKKSCDYWDTTTLIDSIIDSYDILECTNMLDFEKYRLPSTL